MQKKCFSKSAWKDGVYQLQCCGSFQAERKETTSRAIGGPVSGLVDQTPSTLILTMEVKNMINVSLSFSCLSLEN